MKPVLVSTIITKNDRMRDILSRVTMASAGDSTILLVGETGVGKELIADFIHRTSPRHQRPFIKLSLSAMPHDLLESELFGHERGAFTNAISAKKGLFELADGVTIFLDEIAEMRLDLQAKLLRAPQEKEIQRLGSPAATPVDVRILAATGENLEEAILDRSRNRGCGNF